MYTNPPFQTCPTFLVKKFATPPGDLIFRRSYPPRNTSTLHDIVDQVQTFYRKEDIASFMSRKQETVTIRDENGKQKEQKQILTMTVTEAYINCLKLNIQM